VSEPGDGLLGRERARRLLDDVLRRCTADQAEAVLTYERAALTRFADNYIHQNVADATPQLYVRAVFGRRIGVASTARLDDEGVARVVERAEAIARLASDNEEFRGLPGPQGEPGEAPCSGATMDCSPQARAALASIACRKAREAGLSASGSVTTTGQELAVANSQGTFAYTPRSSARLMVVARGDDGSGYAEDSALDVAALDMEAVADRAIGFARRAQHPVAVPPNTYTVILQPEATADIARFLAVLGFGAQAVQEGRSFVAGKRGQTVLGANVTIWDDGHDPSGLPLPFDFEGVPRQRLSLIERGVAGDIALDSLYAGMIGARTTGHALPAANDFYAGPIPLHVFMQPGVATVEEMIRSTERGLLVTSFHYTRVVHPLYVIITGMTRYGTFLIENGEVTRPVKSLRYTQSYLDALRDVQAIGRETRLCGEYITARVPALKIGRFTFTGVTE
jgi:predicted Zn-dependent protease